MKKTTKFTITLFIFLVITSLSGNGQLGNFDIVLAVPKASSSPNNPNPPQSYSPNSPNDLNSNCEFRNSLNNLVFLFIGGIIGASLVFSYQIFQILYQKSNNSSSEEQHSNSPNFHDDPSNVPEQESTWQQNQNVSKQNTEITPQSKHSSPHQSNPPFHAINHPQPSYTPPNNTPPNHPQPSYTPPNNTPPNHPQPSYTPPNNTPPNNIVTAYNHDPKKVCKNTIEVAETTESIHQRRLGSYQPAILEKVSKGKGNYCIIPNQQGSHYLVPKDNLKINEYNYETITILFDCPNYQPQFSNNFKLVHPAIIVSLNENHWSLQKRGKLSFE